MFERKAKVGLLGLMPELYDRWPELKVQMAEFAEGASSVSSLVTTKTSRPWLRSNRGVMPRVQ